MSRIISFFAHGLALRLLAYTVLFCALFYCERKIPNLAPPANHRRRIGVNLLFTGLNILLALYLSGRGPTISLSSKAGSLELFLVALQFLFTMILFNLITWFCHYLMHNNAFFWRIHRVHHLDTFMDISTTARFHPLENIPGLPLTFLFIYLLKIPPLIIMSCVLVDALWNLFIHANVRLPADWSRRLEYVLVTPRMHRLHHSSSPEHQHRNYSATFSFWDRVFGTYLRPTEGLARCEIGVLELRDQHATNFWWLFLAPIRKLGR